MHFQSLLRTLLSFFFIFSTLVNAAPIPVSSELLEARKLGATPATGGVLRLFKRETPCYYVGTFFQLINCNAPADSTKIPYAPEPAETKA